MMQLPLLSRYLLFPSRSNDVPSHESVSVDRGRRHYALGRVPPVMTYRTPEKGFSRRRA